MAKEKPTEESLVSGFIDGDEKSITKLVNLYTKPLYKFIVWKTRREDWAPEIAQETWFTLYQARQKYLPTPSFKGCLFTFAKWRLGDKAREEKNYKHFEYDEAKTGSGGSNAGPDDDKNVVGGVSVAPDDPLGFGQDPEKLLMYKQMMAHLQKVIDGLPDEQREALFLKLSGFSLAEIAVIVNAKEETAKSRIRFAWNKLKAAGLTTEQFKWSAHEYK